MRRRLIAARERYGLILVALVLVWLLKRHYSRASAEELGWILTPTAHLTALVLQCDLAFRPGEGYLSRELSILVSPACAGVNFMIVAFSTLVVAFAGQLRGWRAQARWLVVSAAAAYLTTVLVNTLRIAVSVALAHALSRHLGLTFQEVHRLLGMVVYVTALFALCLTARALQRSEPLRPGARRVLLLALGCYAGVTLLVPLLGGAYAKPEFWSHAAPLAALVAGLTVVLLVKAPFRRVRCSAPL